MSVSVAAVRRAFIAISLLLVFLLSGVGSASAYIDAEPKNRVGDFFGDANEVVWENQPPALGNTRGNHFGVYDSATGVWVYVQQNPWSKFDPLGLEDHSATTDQGIIEASKVYKQAVEKNGDPFLLHKRRLDSAIGHHWNPAVSLTWSATGSTARTAAAMQTNMIASFLVVGGITSLPVVGEGLDFRDLLSSESTKAERGVALASLTVGIIGPNFGPLKGALKTMGDASDTLKSLGRLDASRTTDDFLRLADNLDVSTARNGAVFYSGRGNRELAEAFARQNGRTTLEMTPGGQFLDDLQLFGPNSPLTPDQATQVWSRLSQRFSAEASGNATGFVRGARAKGIFNTVEFPALSTNPNVTNVITGGN